jgi:predicted metalloprotease with PDZ domain
MKLSFLSSLTLALAALSVTLLQAEEPKCHSAARECTQQIRKMLGGRRYLGIQVVELKPGLVIKSVLPDSPAAKVALQPGDRMIGLNGRSLAKATARDFKQILADASNTGRVFMIVQRRGAYRKVEARLEPYPKEYIEKAISSHLATSHTATAGADGH